MVKREMVEDSVVAGACDTVTRKDMLRVERCLFNLNVERLLRLQEIRRLLESATGEPVNEGESIAKCSRLCATLQHTREADGNNIPRYGS